MIKPWNAPVSSEAKALSQRLCDVVPVLTTQRLTLRAPRIGDFAAWCEILCGPRAEHIGGSMTEDEAWHEFGSNVAAWALRGHGMWTVTREDRVLGFTLLGFEPGDQEHELGYLFLAAAEGQGHATEAATAARDFALNELQLPSLVSYVAVENHRSAAVAARLGAVRDGVIDGCDIWRHHPKEGA